jgi:hypothetical protein
VTFDIIEYEFTEFAISANGQATPIEDDATAIIDASKTLEPGLYLLTRLELRKNGLAIVTLSRKDIGHLLFEVSTKPDLALTTEQLRARHAKIRKQRDAEFVKGIGSGTEEFIVFVFVRNLMMTRQMRFGQLEVIPFGGLSYNDEVDFVRRFMKDFHIGDLGDTDELLEQAKKGQPSLVVHFPFIKADSLEAAANHAEIESERVVALLALERGGAGSIFASIIIRRSNGEIHFLVHTPSYQGNLIGGFIAGEEHPSIKARLENLRKSERALLYVEMYREALLETNQELKYFRFWSILETVARSKQFLGLPKRDWDGATQTNRKGELRAIQDNAEELVLELLRSTFIPRKMSNSSFARDLEQGLLSQQIPIWYRRRNCITHGSECLCRAPTLPITKEKYVNCLNARNESIKKGIDMYLDTLQDATKFLLYAEIGEP